MKRILSVLPLVLMVLAGWTQVLDDFSDGDLTGNPPWQGDLTFWQVNAQAELQSNGASATDLIYLSTFSSRLDSTEWRFHVRYTVGGPSASNQLRFYLVSDQADLEGPLNGYFVGVGESGSDDSYDLFRQDGNARTKIIDGVAGLAGGGVEAVVRVLRDDQGNWELSVDTGNGVFQNQGSVLDATHQSANFSGPWVSHTSTRAQSFFFDDIYIGEEILDAEPPELRSIAFESNQRLRLRFSESLDAATAQVPGNYTLNRGIGNPQLAQLIPTQPREVRLELASPLQNNQTYELTLTGLTDVAGNVLANQIFPFTFLLPEAALPGDIILNEFMADPSPSQGLPAEEFVELYNRSNKVIDLADWTISDGSSTGTLPAQLLQPGEYVMLVEPANAPLFAVLGPLISPSSLPGLNNDGDLLILKNPAGLTIDSLRYNLDWYGDPGKAQGGFSLELINPENLDCPSAANWTASENVQGGTPGQENSVFSLQPETDPPFLASASVVEPDEILLCFNEVMDPASLLDLSQYRLDPGASSPIEISIDADARCVNLKFSSSLTRGVLFSLAADAASDCAGNPLPSNRAISLGRGIIPQSFDVVITEFMPDPAPSQGLPEGEFVEIYNRLDQVVELNDFKISDGSSAAQWDDLVLLPHEHLIICQNEFANEFTRFGRVLAIPFLPSQNNSGDTLRLLTPFD
ncbi:MAG: lamin tail domain-containing protein, partial [Bacteroidota bacterium]